MASLEETVNDLKRRVARLQQEERDRPVFRWGIVVKSAGPIDYETSNLTEFAVRARTVSSMSARTANSVRLLVS